MYSSFFSCLSGLIMEYIYPCNDNREGMIDVEGFTKTLRAEYIG